MRDDACMSLADLPTPAALLDAARLDRNIAAMQSRARALGVRLRPHVKTTKCWPVVQRQLAAGAAGITVSTLKEAEQFFAAGVADILYAVGIVPTKLAAVQALRERGCRLTVVLDSVAAAEALVAHGREHGHRFDVMIEIDTDGARAGLAPDAPALPAVAQVLAEGGARLVGVMTHCGASYGCPGEAERVAIAEQERARCVAAAVRLRAAGHACPEVSVGSTPTAMAARHLDGVTELRAGVYAFHDLVMQGLGVCRTEDIALSVLTTVIGHQPDKGWVLVDAGWMAMSRDLGRGDCGYGLVCDENGTPLPGLQMTGANQEHGIVARADGTADATLAERLPVGTRLRVLPNHACATGAQFDRYAVLADGSVADTWSRFNGW
jgi:D-serine deaminase-like pyridoxal phosphate-dependent protein